jgi:hypothetical protein
MFLAIELFAILLLMAVGEGVVSAAPHAARRTLVSLAAWVAATAAAVAILCFRRVAAEAVGIGLALLAGYILWWIGAGIVGHFRGPGFFESPKAGELADLAQLVSGLPVRDRRRIARRVLRKFDAEVALLGLLSQSGSGEIGAEEFERVWNEGSEKALAQAARLAGGGDADSPSPGSAGKSDLRFVAQALCLYERESVERALARPAANLRSGRAARVAAAERLAHSGRERKEARQFGLAVPLRNVRDSHAASGSEIRTLEVIWPPTGLARCGFRIRAAALAASQGILLAYGALAASLGRGSGWVFLGAAVLVHVQTLFAIGDFEWLRAHQGAGAETETGGRHEKI